MFPKTHQLRKLLLGCTFLFRFLTTEKIHNSTFDYNAHHEFMSDILYQNEKSFLGLLEVERRKNRKIIDNNGLPRIICKYTHEKRVKTVQFLWRHIFYSCFIINTTYPATLNLAPWHYLIIFSSVINTDHYGKYYPFHNLTWTTWYIGIVRWFIEFWTYVLAKLAWFYQ